MESLVVVSGSEQSSEPEVSTQINKNTILTSHGRPPWYGHDGKVLSEAFVIGIAGRQHFFALSMSGPFILLQVVLPVERSDVIT